MWPIWQKCQKFQKCPKLYICKIYLNCLKCPRHPKFLNLQNSFTGALVGAGLKTYNNINVRQGKPISNPKAHAMGYAKHVELKLQEMIDKSKSPKGKDKYKNLQKEYKREVMKHVKNLTQIITFFCQTNSLRSCIFSIHNNKIYIFWFNFVHQVIH